MNFIDFCVLIPLCWFGFKGFKNGLIYEIASILVLILGVGIAKGFSNGLALLLVNVPFAKQVSFIIIFVSVVMLVHLAGNLMKKIIKLAIPGAVDHVFGLLFGVCKVLVVSSVILFCIQDVDKREILLKKEAKDNSLTYHYVEPIVPHAMGWQDSEPQNN